MLCDQSSRVLLLFLCIHWIMPLSLCDGCSLAERDALIRLKDGLDDPSNRLASWAAPETDCCSWAGVICDNTTGQVVGLNLRNPYPFSVTGSWALSADYLDPSLLALPRLAHLDLSWNSFRSAPIPEFIGSFKELRYLNLSNAGFSGAIPSHIGNLSALASLDLSDSRSEADMFAGTLPIQPFDSDLYKDDFKVTSSTLFVTDAEWLAGLTSLKVLDMSYVSFERASDWLSALSRLPSPLQVRLSNCRLPRGSFQLNIQPNFTSLNLLDLSRNPVGPPIPGWVFEQSNLEYLNFSNTHLQGAIPASIGNLTSLKVLDLSGSKNIFQGGIPGTMGNLCKLRTLELTESKIFVELAQMGEALSGCIKDSLEDLYLSTTGLTGELPDWLWDLKNLKRLDLSFNSLIGSLLIPPQSRQSSLQELILPYNNLDGILSGALDELLELVNLDLRQNSLKGVLSESNFTNLTKLQHLDLSQNHLQLNLSSDWIPPFQLHTIALRSTQLGPRFPAWLKTQESFYHLDLSNTGISDTLPDWFWNLTSHAYYLNIGINEISGKFPLSFRFNDAMPLYIDLNSNKFYGTLPHLPSNAHIIDLSNNLISGPIPARPGNSDAMPYLQYLTLSTNNISGSIPFYLCKSEMLDMLDLSWNRLSGEIPGCWNSTSTLDFSHNNLVGRIPHAIGSLTSLKFLNLRNNNLSGELTTWLKNCRKMFILDLGYNKLSGKIPTWVEEIMPDLMILILRSNMFFGTIPPQLSHLKYLKVLDLANNHLSGAIPKNFGNFRAMITTPLLQPEAINSFYKKKVMLIVKGRELEFGVMLKTLPITMDLSGNNLSGTVPEEMVINLLWLQSLNLSGNYLTGDITAKIGGLEWLESLDLSRNQFSGEIPRSLSGLNFLTHLNLSYNNFSGRIPIGNQLQTLDNPTIYIGNPHLCGQPLNRECQSSEAPKVRKTRVDGDDDDDDDDDDDGDTEWFLAGIGLGFTAGLWVVCGISVLSEKLRNACFSCVDSMLDGLCNVICKWPWVVGWILFSVFVCLAGLWNWVWR